jgi:hypothetical protein
LPSTKMNLEGKDGELGEIKEALALQKYGVVI